MAPADVKKFISELEAHGLTYLRDRSALDIAVIDQQRGFAAPCDWAETGRIESGSVGGTVLACRFVGSSEDTFITPDGWIFEGSLSQKFTFVENGRVPEYLDFVRSEDGIQVYRDIRVERQKTIQGPNDESPAHKPKLPHELKHWRPQEVR